METNPLPYFVAIGASGAEGLHDIADLLGAWPKKLHAVVMVVLHRRSDEISCLQEILARHTRLPVVNAQEGQPLLPSVCYIGEPDRVLRLLSESSAFSLKGLEIDHGIRRSTHYSIRSRVTRANEQLPSSLPGHSMTARAD